MVQCRPQICANSICGAETNGPARLTVELELTYCSWWFPSTLQSLFITTFMLDPLSTWFSGGSHRAQNGQVRPNPTQLGGSGG